jgi:sugar/nucleoside kinase (ribokinase family)
MYIETNTLPKQHTPSLQGGVVDLLCIGNAMVDVFAVFDFAVLDSLGISEAVQHIDRRQAERLLSCIDNPMLRCGGGASNAAKTAAQLNVAAAFAGCVGADQLGGFFQDELQNAGVIPLLARGKDQTGICLVLNNGKETRVAASPSAALEFNETNINNKIIQNSRVVVLDGHLLERRVLCKTILQAADRMKIPAALDAASVFVIHSCHEDIIHYSLNYPMILFMNADEGIAFYHALRKGKNEPVINNETNNEAEKEEFVIKEVCPILQIITAGRAFPILVIKLGCRGALAVASGVVYRAETHMLPVFNTVGAGDAFCAAFLAAWITDKRIAECLAMGNKAALTLLSSLPRPC